VNASLADWTLFLAALEATSGRRSPQNRLVDILEGFEHVLTHPRKSQRLPADPLTPGVFLEAYQVVRDQIGAVASLRQAGAYYTPTSLTQPITEHAVGGTLVDRLLGTLFPDRPETSPAPAVTTWTRRQREEAESILLDLAICDPAAGPAAFLLSAGRYLADRLAILRQSDDMVSAWTDVVRSCLFGVEIDPASARAAQIALWIAAGCRPDISSREMNVQVGDSLRSRYGDPLRGWQNRFPKIFGRTPAGFDVVVGNPPFANAIEDELDESIRIAKRGRKGFFSELTGTADLAYYFLVLADRLVRPDGAVGLVLPRALLSTPSARDLRARLVASRPPALIYAPPDPSLFHSANIFVTALVLRRSGSCLVSRSSPRNDGSIAWDTTVVESEQWWSAVVGKSDSSAQGPTLGSLAHVAASMTTGMAYDLIPYVAEDEQGELEADQEGSLRLVTTGLIDPGVCRWGEKTCRYLKHRFDRPIIRLDATTPATLRVRIEKMTRPKILVAGLSTRIEACLDRTGRWIGAVSTYSITDPDDDITRLGRLVAFLNGPGVSEEFRRQLGATALGGGRITVTKGFLTGLTVPADIV
jgi:hypothetical protein